MEPLIERLKKRADFLRVAKSRKKWVSPGLILQVRSHPADGQTDRTGGFLRLGFTVSKKVGNAVTRNRAKRRLRALAQDLLPKHAQGGFDLVLIGRYNTPSRAYSKLAADLLRALQETGVAQHSTPGSPKIKETP